MYKKLFDYFSRNEMILWCSSVAFIVLSFCIFDRENYLTLSASLIGVTSLIFNAKGNPFGQFLMVIFSLLYGIISFTFAYYGEMITYLGMTMPMAVFALVSWLKNPYNGNRSEAKVNSISKKESFFALAYASNDIVLIVLWALAGFADTRYLSVVVCFLAFFVNDVYGFINWKRMKERQKG